jgi:hypothetical protein
MEMTAKAITKKIIETIISSLSIYWRSSSVVPVLKLKLREEPEYAPSKEAKKQTSTPYQW